MKNSSFSGGLGRSKLLFALLFLSVMVVLISSNSYALELCWCYGGPDDGDDCTRSVDCEAPGWCQDLDGTECNAWCGNAICEVVSGEDQCSCPKDCPGTCGGPPPPPLDTCEDYCAAKCDYFSGSCSSVPSTIDDDGLVGPDCLGANEFSFSLNTHGCTGNTYCLCNRYCMSDADCPDEVYCSGDSLITEDWYCKPGKWCHLASNTTTDCADTNDCTTDYCGSGTCINSNNAYSKDCSSSNAYGTCDGYNTCSGGSYLGCNAPTPAAEICDSKDNDCDGATDAADTQIDCCSNADCAGGLVCDLSSNTCKSNVTCYNDADGDSYGNAAIINYFLGSCGTGNVSNDDDCNDGSASIHPEPPAVTELCDGVDNDCNGLTTDGSEECTASQSCDSVAKICRNILTWYRDADGDNYGNSAVTQSAVSKPAGYVSDKTDCDDTVGSGSLIYPGAPEVCSNGVDNDCDGLVDCADPDCAGLNPEICNDGIDNDCDGAFDAVDSNCCPTFSTSKSYFEIRNRTNDVLLRINQDGNLWIKGIARYPWINPPASAASDNNFVIQNSTGDATFWVSGKTGDMYLRGGISESVISTNSSSGNFVIQDSTGTSRAWVNGFGAVYLKGCFGARRTFS